MTISNVTSKTNTLTPERVVVNHFCEFELCHAPLSPWGRASLQVQYDGESLGEVSNGSHGGFYVRGDWAKKIPYYLRRTWYEEDSASLIPAYYLYDELKALQQAYQDRGKRYPPYGLLAIFGRRTKEEMLEHMLVWHRAPIDFHYGRESVREVFSCDDHYETYLYQLRELRTKRDAGKAVKKIKAGDIVEFERPITFNIDGERLKLTRFQAITMRTRALRFKPLDCSVDFVARISHLDKLQFSIAGA